MKGYPPGAGTGIPCGPEDGLTWARQRGQASPLASSLIVTHGREPQGDWVDIFRSP